MVDIMGFIDYVTPLAPHLILIIAALVAPAIGMKSGKATEVFMIIAGVFAMIVTGYLMWTGYVGEFEGLYQFNTFTGLMSLLFLSVFILVAMMSSAEGRKHHGEYFALLAVSTVGMMLVCAAEDMISLFVGLELANITAFALVAFKKNDPRSSEAAVKFLITSGLSTALFLYGMSLVYGFTGSMSINEIIYHMAVTDPSVSYMVAIVVLIAGFAFKISVIPFHAWVPDVYEGAPTPVSTFLAIGSKKMGFVVFFKLFLLLFIAVHFLSQIDDPTAAMRIHELQWVFGMLAAGTMIVGNVVAISQTSIKRMLAYSTIAQSGYLMIVLCVGTEYAMATGLFYMIVHVFMKGGAFIVVAALAARGLGENISDYKGLSKRAPLVAFAMLLFMFALAGIPPLAGFTAKFFLFSSAVTPDGTWIWLVAVAVINSAISLYYYAKVVKTMYVDKGTTSERIRISGSFKLAIAICAIGTIIIGLYPGPVLEICEAAANAYIGGFKEWLFDFHSELFPPIP
ncbi:MAG: NADH-quinone oxidoreductase subunit N [Methanomassiliicoccaceae archaeon]|nr:NADH-quinone oxidoreductase subunit N [Methanomassiliicoccaceae archaeon]